MGCGNTKTNDYEGLEGDLLNEALGADSKKVQGVKAEERIESHKVLNEENPLFNEENLGHGDESGSIKPYLSNIIVILKIKKASWKCTQRKQIPCRY